MKLHEVFESAPCSRCCGNPDAFRVFGHVAGGRCLKCMGALRVFTKRGQRDYDAWRAAVDAIVVKPLAELKVGDWVKLTGMSKHVPVAAISEVYHAGTGSTNGVVTEHYAVTVTLDREVRIDTGTPLGTYKTREFTCYVGDTVRIHPGPEFELPKAQDFATHTQETICA